MSAYFDVIMTAVGGVCLLVSTYEGTRQLCHFGRRKSAIFLLTFGMLISMSWASTMFYMSSRAMTLAIQMRPLPPPPLPTNWEVGMSHPERAEKSRLYAWMQFASTGLLIEHFETLGGRRLFAASQEDIQTREAYILAIKQTEDLARRTWDALCG